MMIRKWILLTGFAGVLWVAGPARAEGAGDEVVVVYNTRVPESKGVAEHYAEQRHVPDGQVIGFDLPTEENISRTDYRDRLETPLAKALKEKKLFSHGTREVPAENGKTRRVTAVTAARIRYLVLCYGVPLRITADASLREAEMEKLRVELRRNEAAVDSELACLPFLEQKFPRTGPLNNPVFGLTNAAQLNPTNGVLLVARLDGPTAGIARGLVDKAMQAEKDGLWGRAYFDLRGLTNGNYKLGDDWIRNASQLCGALGFETVVDERGGTFPASFPLSQVALYAGWYDEHVSGPFTLPAVEFMPGAFAYHLHSFSAETLRSTTRNWAGPLLAKGATATMGCVAEPYLGATPNVGIFFARFVYSGFSFGEAAYACQNVLSWQTTVVGDPLYRPFRLNLAEQHKELEREHGRYLDWSYLRLTNLRLANHESSFLVTGALEELELAKQSPVLQEKLAELYAAQGKPSSSVLALQKALTLEPTPQQRVRLMLNLITRLIALNRDQEAYDACLQFLKECPGYPDPMSIYRQLLLLARKLGKEEDAAKFEHEISRDTSLHAPVPSGPPLRPGI